MKNIKVLVFGVWLIWLILGFSPTEAVGNEKMVITVPPELEVETEKVYLGRIAVLEGVPPGISEQLNQVYLCPAPRYAETTWLYRTNVRYALDRSGLSGEYDLQMPLKVKISRAGQLLTKEMLLAAVETNIREKAAPFWTEWRLEPGRIPERKIPQGKLEIQPDDADFPVKPGLLTVRLRIMVEGKVFTTLPVTSRLVIQAPVYVSAKRLAKHEILTADSLRREIQELKTGKELLTTLTVEQYRVTREIPVGRVLSVTDLQETPVVVKGSKLRLILTQQPIRLELYVEAEEDGWLGDRILVTNLGSNRQLRATVVGPGLVEVKLE